MRKLTLEVVFILFLICNPTLALASTWANIYGGSGQEYSSWAVQTSDGGFVIVGNTNSFGSGDKDLLLVKLDQEGNIVWQKTYGGINAEDASVIEHTFDGGYIVAGTTITYGISDYDFWLLRFDSDFNIIWQKYYVGAAHNRPYSVQETSDGGFVVAGINDFADSDCWILKVGADGEVVWQNTYDREGYDDSAFSVRETSDGGYLVAAQTEIEDFQYGTTNIDIMF